MTLNGKSGQAVTDEQLAERAKLAGRAELRTRFASMSSAAARHLAEEIREVAFTEPRVHRRVMEALERLGISFPPGFK